MLYLRPDEQRSARPTGDRTLGLMIKCGGRRYFFPGSSPAVALSLCLLPPERLEAPDTVIEFGTADGTHWAPEKVLKAAETTP